MGDLRRPVRRAIVDDHNFVHREGLCQHALDRVGDERRAVIGGNDGTHPRFALINQGHDALL